MEVTKLQLNGNEYNFTDADAHSKISEIKENTYTKDEVDNTLRDYAKTEDIVANYQPKGDYLTEHQSLDNYYNKSEVDKAINAIPIYDDTALSGRVTDLEAIDHSKYLTEHQNISNLATKNEVKEVSDKVDAIEIPSKVSELTNDSKYQTESLVNSAIQKVVGAAPEALDTLEEIADKLKDNDDAVAGIVNTLSEKANTSDLSVYETIEGAADKYQPKGGYVESDDVKVLDYIKYDTSTVNAGISEIKLASANSDLAYIKMDNPDSDKTRLVFELSDNFGTNDYSKLPNGTSDYILFRGRALSADSENTVRVAIGKSLESINPTSGVLERVLNESDLPTIDKTTIKAIQSISSLSHVKDDNAFSSNANEVKLNFDCISTNAVNNPSVHSVPIPVASSTSAGIITAADKTKLDNTPNIWTGTEDEYNALTTKDANTLYLIPE